MQPDRFERLIDRHGPDLDGWPTAERQAAEALLARSPETRAALARARSVEAMLREGLAPEAAPAALRAALEGLPAALTMRAQRRSGWTAWAGDLRLLWRAGATALAASLVAGFVVGALGGLPDIGADMADAGADLGVIVYGAGQEETL